jgi:formamidopyrimidine-DNA glycosylase
MPELPEVEAWVRELAPLVARAPVESARPGHIATLKSFEPPPSVLEGRSFSGSARRGKNLLFPTDDGELVLRVHLMSAGRLRYLRPNEKQPKTSAFRLAFEDGGTLLLTEAGAKKRAKVGLYTPDAMAEELAHLGPEAYQLPRGELATVLASDSRRLHAFLRDQRLIAGIGRAWANEILNVAELSPYALTTELTDEEVTRLSAAIDSELARGLELRERGASDKKAYRVHNRLGEPCPRCGTPIARVDFEEHTIFYCPSCQTEGRILKDRRLSRLLR